MLDFEEQKKGFNMEISINGIDQFWANINSFSESLIKCGSAISNLNSLIQNKIKERLPTLKRSQDLLQLGSSLKISIDHDKEFIHSQKDLINSYYAYSFQNRFLFSQ